MSVSRVFLILLVPLLVQAPTPHGVNGPGNLEWLPPGHQFVNDQLTPVGLIALEHIYHDQPTGITEYDVSNNVCVLPPHASYRVPEHSILMPMPTDRDLWPMPSKALVITHGYTIFVPAATIIRISYGPAIYVPPFIGARIIDSQVGNHGLSRCHGRQVKVIHDYRQFHIEARVEVKFEPFTSYKPRCYAENLWHVSDNLVQVPIRTYAYELPTMK